MELKCKNKECNYVWKYKGQHKFYATCPNCLRKVAVIKDKEKKESEDIF